MPETAEDIFERIKAEEDYFQKAKLIFFLRKNKELTLASIAAKIGLKPSHVSHILRLLKLPSIVVDGYYSKIVTVTHLFILARLPDATQMLEVYEEILAKSLTSTQTEHLIRERLYNIMPLKKQLSSDESKEFIEIMKLFYPEVTVKLYQTRIRAKVSLEVKGDSEVTTEILKSIIKKLTAEVDKKELQRSKIVPLD